MYHPIDLWVILILVVVLFSLIGLAYTEKGNSKHKVIRVLSFIGLSIAVAFIFFGCILVIRFVILF